ncbi:ORC1-type DNA replication protein [Candidatus Woesearchaeota archaeon]|nr:ORC1-type DNA replication protein [Candidatus Woesearchaeota archaeon]
MSQKELKKYFEKFLSNQSIFSNKSVLQSSYVPETVLHREEQMAQIAEILGPILRTEKPSNLFIYGKTGTGKTVTIKYLSSMLKNLAKEKEVSLKIIYLNCKLKKIADTEYRLVAQLIRQFGKSVPSTGLPTDEIYNIFYRLVDHTKILLLIVLDEVDQLVKKAGDEILYNLTRINTELTNSQICFVGISNSLVFTENMDPRVKSSLNEEEVVFPPYNAIQIQDILRKRAKDAFHPGTMGQGVLEKCAAYAAREHGDARRALELLRVAGEIVERRGESTLALTHIDLAEEKIECDSILEVIKTQPKQSQAALYGLLLLLNNSNKIFTGDVYEKYRETCAKVDLRPLTQRRISDILAELDMLGIINANVISKGRHGRMREMSLGFPANMIPKVESILSRELGVSFK